MTEKFRISIYSAFTDKGMKKYYFFRSDNIPERMENNGSFVDAYDCPVGKMMAVKKICEMSTNQKSESVRVKIKEVLEESGR